MSSLFIIVFFSTCLLLSTLNKMVSQSATNSSLYTVYSFTVLHYIYSSVGYSSVGSMSKWIHQRIVSVIIFSTLLINFEPEIFIILIGQSKVEPDKRLVQSHTVFRKACHVLWCILCATYWLAFKWPKLSLFLVHPRTLHWIWWNLNSVLVDGFPADPKHGVRAESFAVARPPSPHRHRGRRALCRPCVWWVVAFMVSVMICHVMLYK